MNLNMEALIDNIQIGAVTAYGLLMLAIAVLWYFLQAIGFYKLSKNRGIRPTWIAWIPLCQDFLLGDLVGNRIWGIKYTNWILVLGKVFFLGTLVFLTENLNPFLIIAYLILLVSFTAYRLTALFRLYQIYTDEALLYLILSLVFNFLVPVFVFIIRNNKPKLLKL